MDDAELAGLNGKTILLNKWVVRGMNGEGGVRLTDGKHYLRSPAYCVLDCSWCYFPVCFILINLTYCHNGAHNRPPDPGQQAHRR